VTAARLESRILVISFLLGVIATRFVATTLAGTADEVDIDGDSVERGILCRGTIFDLAYQVSIRL